MAKTSARTTSYYTGGLAELVDGPSATTARYLTTWLRGNASWGTAVDLLALPHQKLDLPLVEVVHGKLLVNVTNEEKIMYEKTLLAYKPRTALDDDPKLSFSLPKLFSLVNIANTSKILARQTLWLTYPQKYVALAYQLLGKIPDAFNETSLSKLDKIMQVDVLPKVLAIGYLAEFFQNAAGQKHFAQIQSKSSHFDWLTDAIKRGNFGNFDYELADHVISKMPKSKLLDFNINKKYSDNPLIDAAIKMQAIRLESKRKALYCVNEFRGLLPKVKKFVAVGKAYQNFKREGVGRPVSKGEADGICLNVKSSKQTIPPNTIGIFPNASITFSNQFIKCRGLIFCSGGQTSHGAIVAREFSIPALIDPKAAEVPSGVRIELNGANGEWKITS